MGWPLSCNDLGESYVWALCPSNRSAEQKMPSFSATAGLGGPGPTPSFGARIGVPDEHSRGGAASLASFLLPEKVEGVQSREPGCQAPFLRFPCPPPAWSRVSTCCPCFSSVIGTRADLSAGSWGATGPRAEEAPLAEPHPRAPQGRRPWQRGPGSAARGPGPPGVWHGV